MPGLDALRESRALHEAGKIAHKRA
jgi:hypothetical protein